jgi:iron complex transport system substrate-binding protein
MKKTLSLFLAMALALSLNIALADTLTDMAGREVAPVTAQRVVILTPSDVEILYALGAGDTLVGRGEYADHPAEALEVPSVQSGMETNLEQIIALAPDLVIMGKMAQTVEQSEKLMEAGITVAVTDAQDIAGTYRAIMLIGALVGKAEEAAALTAQMQARFDAVREKAAAHEASGSVYFEVSPLQWGLWTTGQGTFMQEMAELMNLTNAFEDVSGWAEVSQEQVLERDPDYIVTVSMYWGEGPTPVEEIMGREGWDALKALQNGHVLQMDSDQITRPGPRLADAAELLYELVYNDAAEEAPAA